MFHLLAALSDTSSPAWWIVAGTVLTAVLSAYNRTLDSRDFRLRISQEIGKLKQKDIEQQTLIEQQRVEIDTLRRTALDREVNLSMQRQLKHAFRNHLNDTVLVVELYRKEHGRHELDTLDLSVIHRLFNASGQGAAAGGLVDAD